MCSMHANDATHSYSLNLKDYLDSHKSNCIKLIIFRREKNDKTFDTITFITNCKYLMRCKKGLPQCYNECVWYSTSTLIKY